MPTRREFLTRLAVTAGVSFIASPRASLEATAAGQEEIKTAIEGAIGLQLWSLRQYRPKDVASTLAKAHGMGFRAVESAGLWGETAGELRGALDAAGLRCLSAHMNFARLERDAPAAFAEANALGPG